MRRLVLPLLRAGLAPEAVFVQLRTMYDVDVNDREIRDLISWAASKNPKFYNPGTRNANTGVVRTPARVTIAAAIANAEQWLNGFRCDECSLWHLSPWQPLEDWRLDPLMLFAALYAKDDYINIVTDFTVEQKDDGQKANPKGAGQTMGRDDWMRCFRDIGIPKSRAGAWIRPNPVKQHGTGRGGAITDANVTSHRFCLLESDALPLDLQLSLFGRLPLPIAAIVRTGGRSIHAWVMLNCESPHQYRDKVDRVYGLLSRFGICPSNKNASRLSRLPGVEREIGRYGDGEQRLLYLNPEPIETAIFEKGK